MMKTGLGRHLQFIPALMMFLVCAGCGAIPLDQIIPVFFYCAPSTEGDPGCIDDEIKTIPLGTGHILILPGILGSQFGSLDEDVAGRIDVDLKELLVSCIANGGNCGWSAQIWDWTRSEEVKDLRIDLRLQARGDTRAAARKLARRLREWHFRNPNRRISLMCGSGGALIAVLAAESLDGFDRPILPPDFMFERVVFVSAALPTSRSLEALYRHTKGGIYNYYSYNDGLLAGHLCSSVLLPVGFPVILRFQKEIHPYAWPAAGRFGYGPSDANLQYIAGQLAWSDQSGPPNNNNGAHLSAYRKEYFVKFILPVLVGNDPPAGWSVSLDPSYESRGRLTQCSSDCDSEDVPAIPDTATKGLVIVIPGQDGVDEEDDAADRIIDELDIDAVVWDWTEMADVESKSAAERLEFAEVVGVRFAQAVNSWRQRNEAELYVLAVSGGSTVLSLACEAMGEDGVPIIADGTLRRVVFSSGLQSMRHSLASVARSTQSGIYN